ncbi:MAG: hypothetical protein CMO35_00950 [Verrucomicrobiaceae bacterium]|jgi:hypothetical protein|nr:hypothetical protein [Verrucomicrobiaceae bacterium]|tara:strand:+ start:278 stop:706 length:429 start_codon:yes stop_codon:yes gene_type:complete
MEYLSTTPWLDIIILLLLMLAFARHEADWEPTTARSGVYFWFLNPKAVLVFLPLCILCRLLMRVCWGSGQILILLLFFLPLAPLLHRFFYVPWRKAFLIAGCFLCYMILVAVGIYRVGVAETKADEGLKLEEFLRETDGSGE